MTGLDGRRGLLVFSILLALMEVVDGFRLELPWMAWAYAALLLGGVFWLWRSPSRAPVVFLGILHLIELLLLVFVFRTADDAPPTALLIAFVLVSLGGTAAATVVLARKRR